MNTGESQHRDLYLTHVLIPVRYPTAMTIVPKIEGTVEGVVGLLVTIAFTLLAQS